MFSPISFLSSQKTMINPSLRLFKSEPGKFHRYGSGMGHCLPLSIAVSRI
jgi:hypothetical protein